MCNSCEDNKETVGIPESEWTKDQREFVGTQFPTPKGGVLTVTEVVKARFKGDHCKYILECSICSKDEDLWPYGIIKTTKSNLRKGQIPCGCAKVPKWREWQQVIKVERECKKRGYIFRGWVGGFKGKSTKLDLENPTSGNRWYSSTIVGFTYCCYGDPSERGDKIREGVSKSDKEHIKGFYKTGFTENYKFWRSCRVDNKGTKNYWYYTCPVCSNDEYVNNKMCTGVFESYIGHLKRGIKSCRCSPNYRWSQEQREYQIKKICKDERLIFKDWEEGIYTNSRSRFIWECSNGHNCTTMLYSFLNSSRCSTCDKEKKRKAGFCNGYYLERVNEEDYLYIIKFGDRYIKVGRSFNIENRLTHTKTGLVPCSGLTRENIKILKIFTSNHQCIYDTEQWLHSELRERGFEYNNKDGLWSIELFDMDSLPVLDYLLKDTDLEDVSDNYKD